MNANDEEKLRLEEEASRVAQRAAEALRQSRMLRNRESISVPTWTGKSGAASALSSAAKKFGSTLNSKLVTYQKSSESSSKSRTENLNSIAAGASAGKALTSADLLAKIRGNQAKAGDAGIENQLGSASNSHRGTSSRKLSASVPEVLVRQISTFIQQRGGTADS